MAYNLLKEITSKSPTKKNSMKSKIQAYLFHLFSNLKSKQGYQSWHLALYPSFISIAILYLVIRYMADFIDTLVLQSDLMKKDFKLK